MFFLKILATTFRIDERKFASLFLKILIAALCGSVMTYYEKSFWVVDGMTFLAVEEMN